MALWKQWRFWRWSEWSRTTPRRERGQALGLEYLEDRTVPTPIAIGDSYVTNAGVPLQVAFPGVLTNDIETEGRFLQLQSFLDAGPRHGALSFNVDGSFLYTPTAGYAGTDSFTYHDNNGLQNSNVATVSIVINGVNQRPAAFNDAYSTEQNRPLVVSAPGVLGNDHDPQNRPLTATLATSPQNGSLTFNLDGSFTYVPNANFKGSDTFTYRANNGLLDSDPATVVIAVNPGGTQVPVPPGNKPPGGRTIFAVGGGPGRVQVRKDSDGTLLADFQPYGASYTGSVTVAVGDVNGDGVPDLVVGAASGGQPVKVYNGKSFTTGTFSPSAPDQSLLVRFFPYGASANVGVNVAVGDISKNGFADIVTGANAGNPDVRVYSGKDIAQGTFNATGASLLAQWFPYGLQFNVGANVAVGDVNGDGFADVVTGATAGNPDVRVYNGQDIAQGTFNPNGSSLLAQFFAYGLQFNVGVNVAVGDVNGTGFGDIITGATIGNPHVKVFDGQAITDGSFQASNPDNSLLDSFFAYDLQFDVGVRVGVVDVQGNGKVEILTGASSGAPHFRVVAASSTGVKPPVLNGIEGIPNDLQGGIYVGG